MAKAQENYDLIYEKSIKKFAKPKTTGGEKALITYTNLQKELAQKRKELIAAQAELAEVIAGKEFKEGDKLYFVNINYILLTVFSLFINSIHYIH